jgi:hypothetical protein
MDKVELSDEEIAAAALHVRSTTVERTRQRFVEENLGALDEHSRPGVQVVGYVQCRVSMPTGTSACLLKIACQLLKRRPTAGLIILGSYA